MSIPVITILSQDKTKISDEINQDQCIATFISDTDLTEWVAKANIETILENHNGGIMVETGGALTAGSVASVYVDNEELTLGDGEYHISVYGKNSEGYWSDGIYDGANLFSYDDIVETWRYTRSNDDLIFNTDNYNTSLEECYIKVQLYDTQQAYLRTISRSWNTGNVQIILDKTSDIGFYKVGLNGNDAEAYILVSASGLSDGAYNISFNITELDLNRAVINSLKVIREV